MRGRGWELWHRGPEDRLEGQDIIQRARERNTDFKLLESPTTGQPLRQREKTQRRKKRNERADYLERVHNSVTVGLCLWEPDRLDPAWIGIPPEQVQWGLRLDLVTDSGWRWQPCSAWDGDINLKWSRPKVRRQWPVCPARRMTTKMTRRWQELRFAGIPAFTAQWERKSCLLLQNNKKVRIIYCTFLTRKPFMNSLCVWIVFSMWIGLLFDSDIMITKVSSLFWRSDISHFNIINSAHCLNTGFGAQCMLKLICLLYHYQANESK